MRIENTREIQTNVANAVNFTISNDASKIFSMLASTLYADKELAVTYELGANCYDANPQVPFHVTMPTTLDPHVRFRDFGPGLSEVNVYSLLTVFGASSKSSDNNSIGGYGIGAKSPAAVTDTWTVGSHHNGKYAEYLVFVNENGVPSLTKIRECDTEETGLEVAIPVQQARFSSWKNAVAKAFNHYPIKPVIVNDNINWEDLKTVSAGQSWRIVDYKSYYNRGAKFITTHRAYDIDKEKLSHEFTNDKFLVDMLSLPIFVEFDIGEIQLSLSRENIQYTKTTVSAIRSKLEKIKVELIDKIDSFFVEAKDGLEFRQKIFEMSTTIFGSQEFSNAAGSIILRVINEKYPQHNIVNLRDDVRQYKIKLCSSANYSELIQNVKDFGMKVYNGSRLSALTSTGFSCFKSHTIVLRSDYNHTNSIDTMYIRVAIPMLSKILFVINDTRDSQARAKYAFDKGTYRFMMIVNKDIFPDEIKKYVVKASDLPKAPRQPRETKVKVKVEQSWEDNVYVIRGSTLAKASLGSIPSSKVAYVTFGNMKSTDSIIEKKWYEKRHVLTKMGWAVYGVKSNKPINKSFVTIDAAFDLEFARINNDDYIKNRAINKCVDSINKIYGVATALISKSLRSSAQNSVWNKYKDTYDAYCEVDRNHVSRSIYEYACKVKGVNPKDEIVVNSFDKFEDDVYTTYSMLKIVNGYDAVYNLDVLSDYITLIDSK